MDMVLELPPTVGSRCGACIDGIAPPFEFSMAFQPVIDLDAGRVYAYEALVRGPAGEPAGSGPPGRGSSSVPESRAET